MGEFLADLAWVFGVLAIVVGALAALFWLLRRPLGRLLDRIVPTAPADERDNWEDWL